MKAGFFYWDGLAATTSTKKMATTMQLVVTIDVTNKHILLEANMHGIQERRKHELHYHYTPKQKVSTNFS